MGLKQQAVKGVTWTSIGTIGYGCLNLLVTIILARLLTPHDFGVIELLVVFSGISDIIVDSGFSQAVIRDNEATDEDLSSVFFFNLLIGCFIYVILFIASPLIASFYETPEMTVLSRFVFLTIIFNSFSVIQNSKFSRSLNFKPFAVASMIAVFVSGCTAITMALFKMGLWALATNLVLFSFTRMLILWIMSSWRPKICFRMNSIRRYFSFGFNLLLQGLLDKVVTNLESLLIGKYYVKQQLGFFSQGRKLDSYVIQTSNNVVQKVSYPLLAKIQGDEARLKSGYRMVMGVTMCCITPVIAIMVCGAEDIMSGIFGQQWLQASPYLRLWSLCGWMVTLYSVFNNIFLVRGKSKLLLRCSVFRQVLRVVAIILLVRVSIISMMYGIVVVTFIGGFNYVYWGGKQIHYPLWEVIKDLLGILLCSLIASSISILLTRTFLSHHDILSLCILSSTNVLIYTSLLYFSSNLYFKEILTIIRKNETIKDTH